MKSTIKTMAKATLKLSAVTLMLLMLSVAGYSQDPGGGPDGPPPAVPFDDYLLVILGVVGIIFTYFFLKSKQNRFVSN